MRVCSGGWVRVRLLRSFVLVTLFVVSQARAEEGLWLPGQIAELYAKQLSKRELELKPADLWNETGGALRAAVNLSGCSAAFVSPNGLILTNHHCVYRAISAQSTLDRDLLKHGFLAKKPADELEAKGYTVLLLERERDVTGEILSEVSELMDDAARWSAIERAQKRLTLECERSDPSLRCEVASFYMGSRYTLFEKREIRDVRLVYAPPAGLGDYGGEVDNWAWPRHTADFAFVRAYVAAGGQSAEHSFKNAPYKPRHWLKIGFTGVRPGEFVAVLGYPGATRRHQPSFAVERYVRHMLPASVKLLDEWIVAIDRVADKNPRLGLKLAAQRKSIANRLKSAQGTLAGIERMKLYDRRKQHEQRLSEFVKQPDRKSAGLALSTLMALAKRQRDRAPRDFLLDQLVSGPPLLGIAIDLVRRARERPKPDLEREPAYMDRNAVALWKLQERRQRDFVPAVEAHMLSSLVLRARELPPDAQIPALARLSGPSDDPARLAAALELRIRASRLSELSELTRLFDATSQEKLELEQDPLIDWALELAPELEDLHKLRNSERGLESRAGAQYFALLEATRTGPIYPDANGTLRFSHARVIGYQPEDGLLARPQTTLLGALKKHTGAPPFDLPKLVRERAAAAKASLWADPHLDDVPVCFLSNADTSGGNSGSAVINAKGELVGVNFDRVWENVAGDFGYSAEYSRNISVDIRYALWILDRVENATMLLRELGAAEFKAATARISRTKAAGRTPSAPAQIEPASKSGCSCSVPAGRSALFDYGIVGLLCGHGLRIRARRAQRRRAAQDRKRGTRKELGPVRRLRMEQRTRA